MVTLVSKTQLHVSCSSLPANRNYSVCIHAPQTGSVHQVVQLHIANWRSDGSCSSLASVRDVIDQMCAVQRRTGNHPITVHCRCVHECGVHVFLLATTHHTQLLKPTEWSRTISLDNLWNVWGIFLCQKQQFLTMEDM